MTASNISYTAFKKVQRGVLPAGLCSNEWPFKEGKWYHVMIIRALEQEVGAVGRRWSKALSSLQWYTLPPGIFCSFYQKLKTC